MAPDWPTDPDDPVDPALAPLIEAGEGESEGFEESEEALIGHARHDDEHGTGRISQDAYGFDDAERSDADYAEGDEESKEDL